MLEANLARFVLPKDLKLEKIRPHRGGYLWEVTKIRSSFEICPKCAKPSTTRAGKCEVLVKDEPLRNERLWLKIHKHRYFCKHCRKSFTETVSIVWPRRRTTQRLRKTIAQAAGNLIDLERVRTAYKVSSGLIYKVYYEQLEIKLRERKGARWPSHVGVDEHFFRREKGFSQFVTMFTDLKKREMFEMGLGKSGKQLIEQLLEIPGREDVKLVAIDLSSSYRSFVKKMFPNAIIVADKFHALRLINPALIRERKIIHGHRQDLKTRRQLLRSRIKLDYFERSEIDRYLKEHPSLNELYRAKEQLLTFYRTKGFGKAVKAFTKMVNRFTTSPHEVVRRLAKTLARWRSEILVYFENGFTNAITETMNNVGKLVQKRGYGYKSYENYRLRTLTVRLF